MNQVRRTIIDTVTHEYVNRHLFKLVKEDKEASIHWADWCVNKYLFGSIMAAAGLGALDEDDELVKDISYEIFRRLDEHMRRILQAKEAIEKDPVTEFEGTAEEVEEVIQAQEDNNRKEEN